MKTKQVERITRKQLLKAEIYNVKIDVDGDRLKSFSESKYEKLINQASDYIEHLEANQKEISK